MTEETKATLKDNLHKTGNSIMATGKKIFTARNLKRDASILVLLAVVGAGGKYMLHQNKVEAKNRADAARTTLLQNLATQNNVTLASTDDVKNKVAQALGVDAAQVNFTSVNLISTEMGKQGGQDDQHERGEKRDSKYERADKHDRGEKHEREDKRGAKHEQRELWYGDQKDAHERGEQRQLHQAGPDNSQAEMQNRSALLPPVPPVAGTAPDQAAQTPDQQAAGTKQQLQRRQGGMPLFYSVKCSKDNVNYHFLVGAQDGKILRSSVEPAHSFLGK